MIVDDVTNLERPATWWSGQVRSTSTDAVRAAGAPPFPSLSRHLHCSVVFNREVGNSQAPS